MSECRHGVLFRLMRLATLAVLRAGANEMISSSINNLSIGVNQRVNMVKYRLTL
jgi:hypothetical protein